MFTHDNALFIIVCVVTWFSFATSVARFVGTILFKGAKGGKE